MQITKPQNLIKIPRKLGKHQIKMLEFARKYTGGKSWHSLGKNSLTQKVAKSLVSRGLIEINEFNQFRATCGN